MPNELHGRRLAFVLLLALASAPLAQSSAPCPVDAKSLNADLDLSENLVMFAGGTRVGTRNIQLGVDEYEGKPCYLLEIIEESEAQPKQRTTVRAHVGVGLFVYQATIISSVEAGSLARMEVNFDGERYQIVKKTRAQVDVEFETTTSKLPFVAGRLPCPQLEVLIAMLMPADDGARCKLELQTSADTPPQELLCSTRAASASEAPTKRFVTIERVGTQAKEVYRLAEDRSLLGGSLLLSEGVQIELVSQADADAAVPEIDRRLARFARVKDGGDPGVTPMLMLRNAWQAMREHKSYKAVIVQKSSSIARPAHAIEFAFSKSRFRAELNADFGGGPIERRSAFDGEFHTAFARHDAPGNAGDGEFTRTRIAAGGSAICAEEPFLPAILAGTLPELYPGVVDGVVRRTIRDQKAYLELEFALPEQQIKQVALIFDPESSRLVGHVVVTDGGYVISLITEEVFDEEIPDSHFTLEDPTAR